MHRGRHRRPHACWSGFRSVPPARDSRAAKRTGVPDGGCGAQAHPGRAPATVATPRSGPGSDPPLRRPRPRETCVIAIHSVEPRLQDAVERLLTPLGPVRPAATWRLFGRARTTSSVGVVVAPDLGTDGLIPRMRELRHKAPLRLSCSTPRVRAASRVNGRGSMRTCLDSQRELAPFFAYPWPHSRDTKCEDGP